MHIHILGICGTFMGGIATIAKAAGHRVTGSDQHVYPPMSTLLEEQGIELIDGYDPSQLTPAPELVLVGNAMKRGNPCVEEVLNRNIPFMSAPQWLHDHILTSRWVIAVSGTHGKTTTSSMVTWILESCGYQPGFAIGGVPGNFDVSARLGNGQFFVIEADEYDTAFFDKRSKFVHYAPRTLIINNIEFDHADIFDDLDAIERQFHHLIRIVPGQGKILIPALDMNVQRVLSMGCWSEQDVIGNESGWHAVKKRHDGSEFEVWYQDKCEGCVNWSLVGDYNIHNGLMAIAAAKHVGISVSDACQALDVFINPKRRLEHYATVNDIELYDDFAHHPTAIRVTLEGLRQKVGGERRIIAVLEPRSNTMKMGILKDQLANALVRADQVFLYQPDDMQWSIADDVIPKSHQPAECFYDVDQLITSLVANIQPKDCVLVMSNGGFGGLHKKLQAGLQEKFK